MRAVELLDVAPADELLEIGCGPGVAVGLVAAALEGGRALAIDRSATAIARAGRRNAAHVANGTVELRETSLETFDPGDDRFDTVFAIDVNLFWTRRPASELATIARALKPGGVLRLFYGPGPGGGPARGDAVERTAAALEAAGFVPAIEHAGPVTCVLGRLRRSA